MIPVKYQPKPGDTSDGIRIVSANLKIDPYHITLQGPAGKAKKISLSTGDYQIERVRNAVIKTLANGIATLETSFPKNATDDYVTREMVVKLKPK